MVEEIKKPTDEECIAYLRRQEQSLFGLACSEKEGRIKDE